MVCFFYALDVNLCVDQNFSSRVSGFYSNLHSIAIPTFIPLNAYAVHYFILFGSVRCLNTPAVGF
jgi:hypothetical protein